MLIYCASFLLLFVNKWKKFFIYKYKIFINEDSCIVNCYVLFFWLVVCDMGF